MTSCPGKLFLLAFKATRDAIRAESRLREKRMVFRVVALPRTLSSACGMALEFDERNFSETEVIRLLDELGIKTVVHCLKKPEDAGR
jgi:hypothetical protein